MNDIELRQALEEINHLLIQPGKAFFLPCKNRSVRLLVAAVPVSPERSLVVAIRPLPDRQEDVDWREELAEILGWLIGEATRAVVSPDWIIRGDHGFFVEDLVVRDEFGPLILLGSESDEVLIGPFE